MDLFTQTVDSSLWTSRAYDDAGYDLDLTPPRVPAINLSAAPPPSLLVLAAPNATALLESHFAHPLGTIGTINDAAIFAAGEQFAVVAAPAMPDAHARAWARGLLTSLHPKRVAVATTLPAFRFGSLACGRTALLGATRDSLDGMPLPATAMLEGVPAAVVCEGAVMEPAVDIAVYVEALEAGGYSGDVLERLSSVIDCEFGTSVDAVERHERELRHRNTARQSMIQAKSSSLYT